MKVQQETDVTLMRLVAQDDRDAFEKLIRRHADGLLTFICRMIGDRHRAEELFQEVFLAVWRKRATYRWGHSFRAWMLGIAVNQCRADFRKARPAPVDLQAASATGPVDGAPSPADKAIDAETAQIVLDAVANLPEQQRTVVVLRIWNGLSYTNISKALDCSEGTARSHMYHALKAMRKHLEPRMR
jgi:RNA polymerase sigma-70 factor (ECF subfamily)